MSEEEKLHNELEENYEKIVEMLSNGNFLQLNGKAINLTELNEYINAQQEEIERLNNIINHIEEICKSSIASVDKILMEEKEIKFKDGILLNRNDYQIVRLKAYRTKSKEILGRIKELKGSVKE